MAHKKTSILDNFPHLMEIGALLGSECELEFVSFDTAIHIHDECIARFGGANGLRDRTLLESALSRPVHSQAYQENIQLSHLAASLGFGMVRNHAFIDGNKRTAFFCVATFLHNNGLEFKPDAADAVLMMKQLASGSITDVDFGEWIKENTPGLNQKTSCKP